MGMVWYGIWVTHPSIRRPIESTKVRPRYFFFFFPPANIKDTYEIYPPRHPFPSERPFPLYSLGLGPHTVSLLDPNCIPNRPKSPRVRAGPTTVVW